MKYCRESLTRAGSVVTQQNKLVHCDMRHEILKQVQPTKSWLVLLQYVLVPVNEVTGPKNTREFQCIYRYDMAAHRQYKYKTCMQKNQVQVYL